MSGPIKMAGCLLYLCTVCKATHAVSCFGDNSGRNRSWDGRGFAERVREVCEGAAVKWCHWPVSDGSSGYGRNLGLPLGTESAVVSKLVDATMPPHTQAKKQKHTTRATLTSTCVRRTCAPQSPTSNCTIYTKTGFEITQFQTIASYFVFPYS